MEKASQCGLVASTAIGETNLDNASVADVIAADANAWGADLIVFGSDGHESVARRILGSVADGVARLSAIRVLTVPLSHAATAS
ncbi:universal stress protein, partial [Thiomonas sp.]|uniref:universal stress protein n=1 Tax=Thiomonas sp. TaxID=2047785 RepID=UPI002586DC15